MRKWWLWAALVVMTCGSAQAGETKDSGWKMAELDKLEDVVLEEAKVRVNNMVLKEAENLLSGERGGVKFTCQARNKGTTVARLAVQMVGLDKDGGVVFALHSGSATDEVNAGEMIELQGLLRLPKGELGKVKTLKYRTIVDRE